MTDENGTDSGGRLDVPSLGSVRFPIGLPIESERIPDADLPEFERRALAHFDRTGDGRALLRAVMRRDGIVEHAETDPCGSPRHAWRVVIPVRGAHDALRACLSIIGRWRRGEWSVVLVASHEEAGAVRTIAADELGPVTNWRVRSTDTPLGFAAASNHGAERGTWPYCDDRILFLNSDALPDFSGPHSFDDALDIAPAAGPAGNNVSGFQCVERSFNALAAPRALVAPTPRLVGWCLAVRRDEFEAVGGWDEGFGIGNYDDDDLSLRLALCGPSPLPPEHRPLVWCPSLFCGHVGSASFRELDDALRVYREAMHANETRFYARWGWALPAIQNWWSNWGWRGAR